MRIYRFILGFIALFGVALQIIQDGWGMMLYYTLLSNLLVGIFLLYITVKKENHYLLKSSITMAILITFLIYHFLLAPLVTYSQFHNLRNYIVHYIVPIAMVLDTLVFDEKNQYKLMDPFKWSLILMIYFGFAMLNGFIFKLNVPASPDSPFPYFFMNVHKFGIMQVGINTFILLIGYIILGYLFLLVKKIIGKLKEVHNFFFLYEKIIICVDNYEIK